MKKKLAVAIILIVGAAALAMMPIFTISLTVAFVFIWAVAEVVP